FAVLSPVAPTASHPHQDPIGWQRFKHLVDASGLAIYALGGLQQEDAPMSRSMGGRGIAAQQSLWR
ncbi:MAG TPA: thiamine phosphate synthase, partial [Bellilinea sp.]|nr:thiamine phosphate synthase [Bellilinea sp.]